MSSHDDTAWIIVPVVLSILIYMSVALFVWPYARPVFSIWILLFSLLFPPAFFVVATYVLVMFCLGALVHSQPAVIVVHPAARTVPVVEQRGRVRGALFQSRGGSRV